MKILIAVLVSLVLIIAAGVTGVRMGDGPSGPLVGGPFKTGEFVPTHGLDWDAETNHQISAQTTPYFVEVELESNATSRTTGIMLYEGDLYIPCDLGFGWARFSGLRRWILNAIFLVKDWHYSAEADGRVVVRMDNKRYSLEATRVTDPIQIENLKLSFEAMVTAWQQPEQLAARPLEAPNDIWFFRLSPRERG